MHCINGNNIFLFAEIYIFLPTVLDRPPVPCVFGIFPVPIKEERLGLVHNLTKDDRGEQFGMIGEHDLLLDTTVSQCSTADVLVSKIGLYLTIVAFYRVIILFQLIRNHWLMIIFLDNLRDCLSQDFSSYDELFILFFPLLWSEMLLEILYNGPGLELLLSKYDTKIVNIRKFSASCWVLIVILQGYEVHGH